MLGQSCGRRRCTGIQGSRDYGRISGLPWLKQSMAQVGRASGKVELGRAVGAQLQRWCEPNHGSDCASKRVLAASPSLLPSLLPEICASSMPQSPHTHSPLPTSLQDSCNLTCCEPFELTWSHFSPKCTIVSLPTCHSVALLVPSGRW